LSRQATLLLPREALCGSHLPIGVCLCRSTERMHDLVIGLFINRYELGRTL